MSSGAGVPGYDAVVLGAGVSGLVSASILVQQGCRRVLVIDEYDQVGGNHLDRSCGGYTFDIGSLIFQDDSPLLAHFPDLLPLYVPIEPTWGRLNPQGMITTYPFSVRDDVLAAGPRELVMIMASAVRARLRRRPPANARDFAEHWIGRRLLHRSGLEHYMGRFFGLPAERIDLTFARQRMMWIAEHAAIRSVIGKVLAALRRGAPEPAPTNTQLARPVAGFGALYRPAVEQLGAAGVDFRLGAQVRSITRSGDGFRVDTDAGPVAAGRLISTVPLDLARGWCGLPVPDPLPTVTLISLFYSYDGERGFDDAILYNFSHQGAWKRLTVYSDFYGAVHDRGYFGVEVIADRVDRSVALADADFTAHVRANGLFRGDLVLEGSHLLEHAYPIYTEGSGDRARQAIADLRAFGVESFGRQGGFQYQPTARASTVEAEAALGATRSG